MSSVVDVIVNRARFILSSYISRILKSHEFLKVYFASLSVGRHVLGNITLHYPFFQASFSV